MRTKEVGEDSHSTHPVELVDLPHSIREVFEDRELKLDTFTDKESGSKRYLVSNPKEGCFSSNLGLG